MPADGKFTRVFGVVGATNDLKAWYYADEDRYEASSSDGSGSIKLTDTDERIERFQALCTLAQATAVSVSGSPPASLAAMSWTAADLAGVSYVTITWEIGAARFRCQIGSDYLFVAFDASDMLGRLASSLIDIKADKIAEGI